MPVAYYNEVDPYACQWLRNLIAAGHLPRGDVDERSIVDIEPADLAGYRQCHFFGGIGGWPYALRLAGFPADAEVWTGSCPCQPLSSAGQRKGHADERHLWPAFYRLIAECLPATIFGEQVASKDGREWLAGVRADLEHLGYAVGAADLCATGVGAPHIRQRLFWVADTYGGIAGNGRLQPGGEQRQQSQNSSAGGGLGDTDDAIGRPLSFLDRQDGPDGPDDGRSEAHGEPRASGEVCGLAVAANDRPPQGLARTAGNQGHQIERSRHLAWADTIWLPCLDGKARRVEPGIFPLADGVSARVGRLRAYGNAIVPQVAAEFIRAVMGDGRCPRTVP